MKEFGIWGRQEEPTKFEIALETIIQRGRQILPMMQHGYLVEDPNCRGAGVVFGHVITDNGQGVSIPLGVVTRDGSVAVFFGEAKEPGAASSQSESR